MRDILHFVQAEDGRTSGIPCGGIRRAFPAFADFVDRRDAAAIRTPDPTRSTIRSPSVVLTRA